MSAEVFSLVHPHNTHNPQTSQPPYPARACPTSHISPLPEEIRKKTAPAVTEAYQIEVYAGLVEVREVGRVAARTGGGMRGIVAGMSRASRRRALQTLCRVRGDQNGLFLTLTYPDEFPTLWSAVKRDLDVFLKRLTRQFPSVGFFWRMEYQRRKSGRVNAGNLAPHFHLLLFGVDDELPAFRAWVAQAWFESNSATDARNKRAGTEVSHIRSRRHAMHYASKYVAKVDSEALAEEVGQTGRMWGYGGELDMTPDSTLVLNRGEYVALRRLVKRWLRAQRSRYANTVRKLEHGFSIMGLGDQSDEVGFFTPTIYRMLAPP